MEPIAANPPAPKSRRWLQIVASAVLVVGVGVGTRLACASDDNNRGSRPSIPEIKDSYVDSYLTAPDLDELRAGLGDRFPLWVDRISDCIAEGIYDSDLPNGVVRALITADGIADVSGENADRYQSIIDGVNETCDEQVVEQFRADEEPGVGNLGP